MRVTQQTGPRSPRASVVAACCCLPVGTPHGLQSPSDRPGCRLAAAETRGLWRCSCCFHVPEQQYLASSPEGLSGWWEGGRKPGGVNQGTEWLRAKAGSPGMAETLHGLPKTLVLCFPELWSHALLSARPKAALSLLSCHFQGLFVSELKQWLPELGVSSKSHPVGTGEGSGRKWLFKMFSTCPRCEFFTIPRCIRPLHQKSFGHDMPISWLA